MRRGGMCLTVAAVLALAACGGDEPTTEERPGLSRAVAERLAEESEAIATKLDEGDTCGAAEQADVLEDAAEEAIGAGDVPSALEDELLETARKLQNEINCEQPQPEPPPPAPAPDCSDLEGEKEALEEQKDEAEGEAKKEIEEQIKALDEEIKACEQGDGEGEGEGEGKGKGKGEGGDD